MMNDKDGIPNSAIIGSRKGSYGHSQDQRQSRTQEAEARGAQEAAASTQADGAARFA
jgi:hypothetical protein